MIRLTVAALAASLFPIHATSDVAPRDVATAKAAVGAAATYYSSLGIPRFGTTVHLYGTPAETVEGFSAATGMQKASAAQFWANTVAAGNGKGVFVDTRAWQNESRGMRGFTIAHELFHVAQNVLEGGYRDQGVRGPTWLDEGAADYFGFAAMIHAGTLSANAARQRENAFAARATKPLSGYESSHALATYGLGYLATRLLVERHGVRSVLRFWRNLRTTPFWQDAFAKAFGETADSFYAAFAATR